MGDYEMNAYYHPEKLGLEQVVCHEFSSGSYEFDTRVIWRHKETGRYYTARDSGCSCPTPFEDYDSLEALNSLNVPELIDEARDESKKEWYGGDDVAPYIEELRALQAEITK